MILTVPFKDLSSIVTMSTQVALSKEAMCPYLIQYSTEYRCPQQVAYKSDKTLVRLIFKRMEKKLVNCWAQQMRQAWIRIRWVQTLSRIDSQLYNNTIDVICCCLRIAWMCKAQQVPFSLSCHSKLLHLYGHNQVLQIYYNDFKIMPEQHTEAPH